MSLCFECQLKTMGVTVHTAHHLAPKAGQPSMLVSLQFRNDPSLLTGHHRSTNRSQPSLNASSRRWAWQCTLHTLHQGLVNLQCWSAFNFAMTPPFLPVITAAPSEPKPTIFFVQSCVSKPTCFIAVFSALQSYGDSSFNDSDSSTPFRLQSSWLRFRLQHNFYERFRLQHCFSVRNNACPRQVIIYSDK